MDVKGDKSSYNFLTLRNGTKEQVKKWDQSVSRDKKFLYF